MVIARDQMVSSIVYEAISWLFRNFVFVHTLVLRKNEAHLEQQCPRLPSQALSPT